MVVKAGVLWKYQCFHCCLAHLSLCELWLQDHRPLFIQRTGWADLLREDL